MTKQSPPMFRFRKTDNIGATSAEDDFEFLKDCFVETEEFHALTDISDIRQILLGRTGSGKSAMLERLKLEAPNRVIEIEPHELALTYVSNSSVIRYFADLGVNLDPFFKLLWRHVLTVEILRKHLNRNHNEERNLWDVLLETFSGKSRKDNDRKRAVEYLRKWGERFWLETEYRVKEITTKLESELSSQLGAEVRAELLKAGSTARARDLLSDEERTEVINRGQRVVSEAQVHDLHKVRSLLNGVLEDPQQFYFILIDRLDEDWVEEKLRYRLIMALLESLKEISRVDNVKVLVAIRRDLLDRVFRIARESGFQEEKYHSLYLPLNWSHSQLTEVLDRRINRLVTHRFQKHKAVTHKDLLPRRIEGTPVTKFICERATRPRDIIVFFNKCIEVAEGLPRLRADSLKRAEGEYSRQRLRALADEWQVDYPALLDFADILKKRPQSFSLGKITYSQIEELCLQSAIEHPGAPGILREQARSVCDGITGVLDFRRMMIMVFYRIGLVGLKLESFERASWADQLGQSVSAAEIDDNVSVVVHSTYRRALGVRNPKAKK